MMQNGAHARALRALLPEGTPIFPMVVFGRESVFYTPVAKEEPEKLCSSMQLKKRVGAKKKGMLTNRQIDEIYQLVLPYTHIDLRDKMNHLRRAQTRRR